MGLFLLVADYIPFLKRSMVAKTADGMNESLGQAVRTTWQKLAANNYRGLATIFFYRLLINGRAIAYFFLAVQFNLDQVYVELTLIRIVLSWVVRYPPLSLHLLLLW